MKKILFAIAILSGFEMHAMIAVTEGNPDSISTFCRVIRMADPEKVKVTFEKIEALGSTEMHEKIVNTAELGADEIHDVLGGIGISKGSAGELVLHINDKKLYNANLSFPNGVITMRGFKLSTLRATCSKLIVYRTMRGGIKCECPFIVEPKNGYIEFLWLIKR